MFLFLQHSFLKFTHPSIAIFTDYLKLFFQWVEILIGLLIQSVEFLRDYWWYGREHSCSPSTWLTMGSRDSGRNAAPTPSTATGFSLGYRVEKEEDWRGGKPWGVWLRCNGGLSQNTGTPERPHFQKNMFQICSLQISWILSWRF